MSDVSRGIFFKNYDRFDLSSGPGESFYENMHKYKSVKDFLNKKRKRNKKRKFAIRKMALLSLAIDFKLDESISPLIGDESSYQMSLPFGGILDEYLTFDDFEGKNITNLNHHNDYISSERYSDEEIDLGLNPRESELYGNKREFNQEDMEAEYEKNLYNGIQDFGRNIYDNI